MVGGTFKAGDLGRLTTETSGATTDLVTKFKSDGTIVNTTVANITKSIGVAVNEVVYGTTDGELKGDATKISYDDTNTFAIGSSGVLGRIELFPNTASKGKTRIQATDNTGNSTLTITNAAQAATRTYTIPDAGASTASFVMTEGTSQSINGNLVLGADASAGTLQLHPGTTNSGTLIVAAVNSSSDVNVTISNADHGQASVVSIPDGGQSTANFVLSEGAATIAGAKTFSTLTRFTDAAVGGTTTGTGITVVHTPGKSVFTLVDHALTVTDSGANGGHGAFTFFTFPEGHIRVESGLATFTKFSAQSSSNADSGVCDIGVGTTATATDNEVLSSTEQDICTKIDTTLDGSGDLSGTVNSTINSTAAAFDGASTAIICSLNAAITAATISATEIFDVSGTITINWTDMGDT